MIHRSLPGLCTPKKSNKNGHLPQSRHSTGTNSRSTCFIEIKQVHLRLHERVIRPFTQPLNGCFWSDETALSGDT
ncbi:MAG: hypothetical protein IKO35_04915, partial [Elusimicrobiaceae bacterium]|nr:hypothetical protein [Elusimicrobiaceae bacterium]